MSEWNTYSQAKLNKICVSTKLNWIDALPLALMHYQMQANRNAHLTPHEMLTRRLTLVLHLRGPYEGPPLEQLQLELRGYIRQLTAQLGKQTNRRAGKSNGPSVYLRMFSRKWNKPRREGLYKAIRVTPTAVQVEGSIIVAMPQSL